MLILIIGVLLFAGSISGNEIIRDSSIAHIAPKIDSIANSDSSFTESTTLSIDTLPLCTLEINTIPSGALISVDGKEYGTSPVSVKIDTGKHTIVCQKEGFYQKKVVIQVTSYQKTGFSLKLTSPAKIKIVTEPPEVQLLINGEKRGITPYVDSLFKPGEYIIKLEKEGYMTKIDSLKVNSGETITRVDTLQKIVASSKDKKEEKKSSFFDIAFVGGTFFFFLLIVGFIELKK